MSQRFIVTFSDLSSYEKYRKEVIDNGGTIINDLGTTLLGFTALMPAALVQLLSSSNLGDNGIATFEPDSVVTTQVSW